jgi:hypothetical protein
LRKRSKAEGQYLAGCEFAVQLQVYVRHFLQQLQPVVGHAHPVQVGYVCGSESLLFLD